MEVNMSNVIDIVPKYLGVLLVGGSGPELGCTMFQSVKRKHAVKGCVKLAKKDWGLKKGQTVCVTVFDIKSVPIGSKMHIDAEGAYATKDGQTHTLECVGLDSVDV